MTEREQVEDAITKEIAAHYDYHPRMMAVHLLDSPAMRDLLAEAWDAGYRDGSRQDAEGDDGPVFENPHRERP